MRQQDAEPIFDHDVFGWLTDPLSTAQITVLYTTRGYAAPVVAVIGRAFGYEVSVNPQIGASRPHHLAHMVGKSWQFTPGEYVQLTNTEDETITRRQPLLAGTFA